MLYPPRSASPSANHASPSRYASLMLVKGKTLNYNSARVEEVTLFLDSGSQKSFIVLSAAQRLGFKILSSRPRTFIAFGGQSVTEVSGVVQVTLLDQYDDELTVEPHC
ncbi:hypothetical protein COOONC_25326 [Cooperia oncophora]